MSIRDEIIAASDPRKVEKCKLARWVDAQPNAAEWLEYLNDPTLKASGISVIMTKYGYSGASDGIRKHRQGDCACKGTDSERRLSRKRSRSGASETSKA